LAGGLKLRFDEFIRLYIRNRVRVIYQNRLQRN